ncbi:hypothetical protein PIB30_058245 [Stylosanthes scabra]|uniref:Uncharacterized protein n=1 Tax=Stylosanthes scabra TaxID=79078 RepID=A0ABU6WI70_9FABA|nr:hypothetical protein [Stylosanthes scabra]
MTLKKIDGYINEYARTFAEAIQEIEGCDQSSKELSHNDSLAQVFGKEHPRRVRGVGPELCHTQIINQSTQQTSYVSNLDVE